MNIWIYSYWGNGTNTNTNNIRGLFYSNIRILEYSCSSLMGVSTSFKSQLTNWGISTLMGVFQINKLSMDKLTNWLVLARSLNKKSTHYKISNFKHKVGLAQLFNSLLTHLEIRYNSSWNGDCRIIQQSLDTYSTRMGDFRIMQQSQTNMERGYLKPNRYEDLGFKENTVCSIGARHAYWYQQSKQDKVFGLFVRTKL